MGCIRLSNEDLKAFSRLVDVDTRVDILPDKGRERVLAFQASPGR